MLSSSTLTPYAYLSQSFPVRRLLAAIAFFICLSGAAPAQTYFSGTPQTIDDGVNAGGVGNYNSQAIVNGNPAISYRDVLNGNLKYVRANDAEGASWGTPVTVDAPGDVGEWNSLAVVNGKPAISYYDATNTKLKYARALDTDGLTWGVPITINTSAHAGHSSSLAVVDGKPAISYYDGFNHDLKYVRALTPEGLTPADWGTTVIVDASGDTGIYTSLEVVAGRPAIAYHYATGLDLRYVRAANADGTVWGAPQTIESGGTTGWYPSLAIVNGNPAVSFFRTSGLYLRYIRATSTDGSTWGAGVKIDNAENRSLLFTYRS